MIDKKEFPLTLMQKKALLYYERTGDVTKLHFFFEPFEGRNYITTRPYLATCNSFFISRMVANNKTFLHKSSEYLRKKYEAEEFINSKISDDDVIN